MQENIPQEFVQPKNGNFLVSLLSILLLLSCIIAGFFAWQTQKLVKELTAYRLQSTATQTPTPTDPTANWKTYRDSKFLFKYPFSWTEPNIYQLSTRYEIDFGATLLISAGSFYDQTKQRPLTMKEYVSNFNRESETVTLDKFSGNRFSYLATDSKQEIDIVIAESLNSSNIYIVTFRYEPKDIMALKIFDQILSTFKFTGSEPATPPIACTEEAKICSDGSSVGRVGPNCEFAPCPTPKN